MVLATDEITNVMSNLWGGELHVGATLSTLTSGASCASGLSAMWPDLHVEGAICGYE